METAIENNTTLLSDVEKRGLIEDMDEIAQRRTEEMNKVSEATRVINDANTNLEKMLEEELAIFRKLMGCEQPVDQEPLELTPEQIDEAIDALRVQFNKDGVQTRKEGYVRQEGLSFDAIEAKLRSEENEAVRVGLYKMVQAGSRPDVVCEERGRFCILETFSQTLSERACCVYDRKAERQVGSEICNGNAVDQAGAMGVPLADRHIAETHLVAFPDRDQCCYDYIQATERYKKRESDDDAPYVCRHFGEKGVGLYDAHCIRSNLGWRGALWV